jgi:glucose/arabinose dehydrogenase
MSKSLRIAVALLAASPSASATQGQTLAVPAHFEVQTVLSNAPRSVDIVPISGGRILTAEQRGSVGVWNAQGARIGTLIDLSSEVSYFYDRGLMSIALHPGFTPDGGNASWIYLYYAAGPDTPNGQGDEPAIGRLTRYRVQETQQSGQAVPTAIASSRHVLLGNRLSDGTCPDGVPILHESHMGAALVFGTDGTLLVSTGDGTNWLVTDTGGLQPWGFDDYTSPITGLKGPWSKVEDSGAFRAQDVRSLAGKVLRIDPATGFGLPSNPFFDGNPQSRPSRVWSLGLRNPFRMSLVPGTGSTSPSAGQPGWLAIADVGSNQWEEINVAKGGDNFGWPCHEGPEAKPSFQTHVHPPNPHGWATCSTSQVPHTLPALAYPRVPSKPVHPPGVTPTHFLGIAVIGGTFQTGGNWPADWQGRYFFHDHGYGFLKALRLTSNGTGASVLSFGEGFQDAVAVRTSASGDMLFLMLGIGENGSSVVRVRYAGNNPPQADFAFAQSETNPLEFTFDGTSSTDPDGDPLTYAWNFGDGSPSVGGATPTKTFAAPGLFDVTLTVTDPAGSGSSVTKPVLAGFAQPTAKILSPPQGGVFANGALVPLVGVGSNGAGGVLPVRWVVDAFIDGLWLESVLVLHGPVATLPFVGPTDPAADWGLRVRLEALSGGAPVASTSVTLHPEHRVVDVAGPASFLAKVLALDPPGSQAFGNPDLEVLRDLVVPGPGASSMAHYATFHPGSQQAGALDWIGYRFMGHHPAKARVFAVEFHAGAVLAEGGWFQNATVEVLTKGQWRAVEDLSIDPPFAGAGAPPAPYTKHRLAFTPVEAEAVRVIGLPGGPLGFVTVGELRVLAAAPPGALRDLTPTAVAAISSTSSLSPPGPQGFGSNDLGKLVDGAEPPPGSTSTAAQVSSYHPDAPAGSAWFGVRFEHPVTANSVRFREGRVWANGADVLGGWLHDLTVETRLTTNGPWVPVQGLAISPSYRNPGPGSLDYEAFDLHFAPRALREIRVRGRPGGSLRFATASELRVFGPHAFYSAWFARAGLGLPADGMTLYSTTPPSIALPVALEIPDGPPSQPGLIAISSGPATTPLGAGTLLIAAPPVVTLPVAIDASGRASVVLPIPSMPGLVGLLVPFQAFAADPSAVGGVRFSNALDAYIGP